MSMSDVICDISFYFEHILTIVDCLSILVLTYTVHKSLPL